MDYPIIKRIKDLIKLAKEKKVPELRVEEKDLVITIKTECPKKGKPPRPKTAIPGLPAPFVSKLEKPPEAVSQNLIEIVAPLVGVFYRSPDPASPPFVEVGDVVEEGDVVGLLEAMKVFNEIRSELRGKVAKVCADNEELVKEGQVLILIEPVD